MPKRTPFDGKPVKGRKFTPAEIEQRKRFFTELFSAPPRRAQIKKTPKQLAALRELFGLRQESK